MHCKYVVIVVLGVLHSACSLSLNSKSDPVPEKLADFAEKKISGKKIFTSSIQMYGRDVTITGYKIDNLYKQIIKDGSWEPHLTILSQMLLPQKSGVVFDIGANMGYTTLQFAALVPEGRVFSFEPYPPNYFVLNKNVISNQFSHVVTFNRAVSNEDINLCFSNVVTNNMGDIRLNDKSQRSCNPSEISVQTIKMDDASIPRLDLMKIDVQGYELKVLKTCKALIMKFRPMIMIEFEEWNMQRMSDKYGTPDIVRYIRNELNYEVIAISYQYPSDHVLVPKEKVEEFRSMFKGHIIPLTERNNVNQNVEAGVKEQLCLRPKDCNGAVADELKPNVVRKV